MTARSWKSATPRNCLPAGPPSSSRAARTGRTTAVEETETRMPAKTASRTDSRKARRATAVTAMANAIWSEPPTSAERPIVSSRVSGNSSPTKKRMSATPSSAIPLTRAGSSTRPSACGPMSIPVTRNAAMEGAFSLRKRKITGREAARTHARSRRKTDPCTSEPQRRAERHAVGRLVEALLGRSSRGARSPRSWSATADEGTEMRSDANHRSARKRCVRSPTATAGAARGAGRDVAASRSRNRQRRRARRVANQVASTAASRAMTLPWTKGPERDVATSDEEVVTA